MRRLIDHPVAIGWLATLAIFGLAVWAGLSEYCEGEDCTNKFVVLLKSRPNEIGDTLAGFAGALAFIWIIVTVALQSKELVAQREELRLTRLEIERQREATQDMALIMGDQTELLTSERCLRTQENMNRQSEELRKAILGYLKSGICGSVKWKTKDSQGNTIVKEIFRGASTSGFCENLSFRRLRLDLERVTQQLLEEKCGPKIFEMPEQTLEFSNLCIAFKDLVSLMSCISVAERSKLSLLDVERIQSDLENLRTASIWKVTSNAPTD